MRATKNTKKMPTKYIHFSRAKNVENTKNNAIPPYKGIIQPKPKKEIKRMSYDRNNANDDKGEDFKEQEYDLDMINQKYKNYSEETENININGEEEQNNNENKNKDYFCEENEDEVEELKENENKKRMEDIINEKYNLPLSILEEKKEEENNYDDENEKEEILGGNNYENNKKEIKIEYNSSSEGKDLNEDKNKEIKNLGEKYEDYILTTLSKLQKNGQLVQNEEKINESGGGIDIPEGVKFGIDETGNPLNISQYLKEEKNSNKKKIKILAYIILRKDKNKKSNNYLIDTKGNRLEKTKEGDYHYKNGETLVVIKDFDVQHPELRVYGHRNYTPCETIDNSKNNNNIYNDNSNKKYIQNYRHSNNTTEAKLLNHSNILDLTNNTMMNNTHAYTQGNSGNQDFLKLMQKWRERYGKKSNLNINNNCLNYKNNSYRIINEDKMIKRTNSILKMAEEINKNKPHLNTDMSNNISYTSNNNCF